MNGLCERYCFETFYKKKKRSVRTVFQNMTFLEKFRVKMGGGVAGGVLLFEGILGRNVV